MSYKTLKVWHEARALALEVYKFTGTFPKSELFGLSQQLRRAAVSIASNIAEGQGRWSHPEQVRFYYMARGSLLEIETQMYIAQDLGYIDTATLDANLKRSGSVGRMLNGLIRKLKKRIEESPFEP